MGWVDTASPTTTPPVLIIAAVTGSARAAQLRNNMINMS
jgi:hypothetical protein